MVKKILFNIFLNIAIIVVVMCMVWAIKNNVYLYAIAGAPPLIMLVYLKIRLAKIVRGEMNRK